MDEKEDVKVAETAGFCWGVKRAMDMTMETANATDGPVHTHGPLIHNPQVIKMLEGKEVYAVDDIESLNDGQVIVIRTHGVTPEVRRELKSRGLTISDATCPLVAKVQGLIKKYAKKGYTTVIIGDRGHAEVIGLMGYTDGRRHIVGSVEDVDKLPAMEKVSVVSQTTCDMTKYDHIIDALKARFPRAVVNYTICEATEERQSEALKMAGEVDALVVIGGKISANTKRLAKIAEEAGADTYLIETEDELDPERMRGYDSIGLTAGASTPTWMIERAHKRLLSIRRDRSQRESAIIRLIGVLVVSNASVAIGAGLMVYANSVLARIEFSWIAGAIAVLYLFSMHALNRLNDVQTFRHNEPEKIDFYIKQTGLMKTSAGFSIIAALTLSIIHGPDTAAVMVFSLLMGLGYTVKWFPKSKIIRIHRLKDIPASKDIFVGVAWAVVTTIIPALVAGADIFSAPVMVAFVFTFFLVYVRSVLSDIRDIHGDRLVGRETIPILIGNQATKVFLIVLTLGLAFLLVSASYLGWVGLFGYALLLSIGYTGVYLALYNRRVISRGLVYDLVVDGVFYFTGFIAFVWSAIV